jgi:hypothetical protein
MRNPALPALTLSLALAGCSKGTIEPTGTGGPRGDTDEPAESGCEAATFYADADLDGFGDPTAPVDACEAPGGYVSDATDCDDDDPRVWPAAIERCDGVDEDCDGIVDDDAMDAVAWFVDGDDDGFGAASAGEACEGAEGWVEEDGDCDDTDASVFPGASDPIDGIDADCDGVPEAVDGVDVTALATLGYVYDEWQQPSPTSPAVRAFGVYDQHTGAPVTVAVRTAEPTILVLVSGDPVEWEVTETWPGTVQEVVLGGASWAPSVPAGATVSSIGPGYFYSLDNPERFALESRVGVEFASFHAVHTAEGFVVDPATTIPAQPEWPECDGYTPTTYASAAPDTTIPEAACPAETSESAWCLSATSGGELVVLGLDSLSTCDVGVSFDHHYDSHRVASLGWIGGDVYGCIGQYGVLERIQLDGSEDPDHAEIWCDAAVADGGQLYTIPQYSGPTTSAYASWEDAQCGSATASMNVGWNDSTYGAADGVGWSAWHSTDTVERYDLAGGGGLLGTVTLDYSGWIYGLGPVGDWIVITTRSEVRIHDATTGDLVDSAALTEGLHGLVCVEG